jgi:hypothetical protein
MYYLKNLLRNKVKVTDKNIKRMPPNLFGDGEVEALKVVRET